MEQPAAPAPQPLPSTQEKQLLILIASLQQQVATLLQQSEETRVEVAKSPFFSRKIEKVSMFINTVCLYLSIKITGESEVTKMA